MRAASAIVLMVLFVAACGSIAPELRMAGDPSTKVGITLSNTPHHAPRSIGSMMLCLSGPGTATITRVALHEPSGDARVDAFAVRPNPFAQGLNGVGAEDRTLVEIGGGFAPGAAQQVDGECLTAAEMNDPAITSRLKEFAVQVASWSGDVAGGTALDVTYAIGGVERTALVPFAIWLCTGTCPDDLSDR
jgi:hypothetical protein